MGAWVFLVPFQVDAEHLFRIVVPDLVIGDQGATDAGFHRALVPRLAHAVTDNVAGLEIGNHLRWRDDDQAYILIRVDAGRTHPVADFVIVGGNGKHHGEGHRFLTGGFVGIDDLF